MIDHAHYQSRGPSTSIKVELYILPSGGKFNPCTETPPKKLEKTKSLELLVQKKSKVTSSCGHLFVFVFNLHFFE